MYVCRCFGGKNTISICVISSVFWRCGLCSCKDAGTRVYVWPVMHGSTRQFESVDGENDCKLGESVRVRIE